MGVQIKGGQKQRRNEPCSCGSGINFSDCHGCPMKQAICNRVANEKMVELIRMDQRKKIIRVQQEECSECGNTGKKWGPDGVEKCQCQLIEGE